MPIDRITRDDAGVQSLKSENSLPAAPRAVNPLAPTTGAHEGSPDATADRNNAKDKSDRRLSERRQGERRRRQLPVILDTRANHDRRNRANSSDTDEATDDSSISGIDVVT